MITVTRLNEMSKRVYGFGIRKGDLIKSVWGYEEVLSVEVKEWEEVSPISGRSFKCYETNIVTNGRIPNQKFKTTESVILVRAEDVKAELEAAKEVEVVEEPVKEETKEAVEVTVDEIVEVAELVDAPVEVLKRSVVNKDVIITAVNTFEAVGTAEELATYKIDGSTGSVEVLQKYNTALEAVLSHDQFIEGGTDPTIFTDPIAEAVAVQMKFLNIDTKLILGDDLILQGSHANKEISIHKAVDPVDGSRVYKVITKPTGSGIPFKYKEIYYNTMAEILEALGSNYGIISNL